MKTPDCHRCSVPPAELVRVHLRSHTNFLGVSFHNSFSLCPSVYNDYILCFGLWQQRGALKTMMKLLAIVALLLVQSSFGFLPLKQQTTSTVPRSLHPEQAAELEACAYDLMREYNTKIMHSASQYEFHHHQPHQHAILAVGGPIAWCRRWIGGRKDTSSMESIPTMTVSNQDTSMWTTGKQP